MGAPNCSSACSTIAIARSTPAQKPRGLARKMFMVVGPEGIHSKAQRRRENTVEERIRTGRVRAPTRARSCLFGDVALALKARSTKAFSGSLSLFVDVPFAVEGPRAADGSCPE